MWGATLEKRLANSCYRDDVKRNRGKSLRITNFSYCFKLIGYWKMKQNAISSKLCQHIDIGNRQNFIILKSIRQTSEMYGRGGGIGMWGTVLY